MTLEWIKEAKGTHVAYRDGKEVAAIQGDGFTGWRYRLTTNQTHSEWSSKQNTVRMAKWMAENAMNLAGETT